jgi:hypothetical protein
MPYFSTRRKPGVVLRVPARMPVYLWELRRARREEVLGKRGGVRGVKRDVMGRNYGGRSEWGRNDREEELMGKKRMRKERANREGATGGSN